MPPLVRPRALVAGDPSLVHELPREALDAHLWSYATIASLPEEERCRVFAAVADVLDSDPNVSDGEWLRLPFAVLAYRADRAG